MPSTAERIRLPKITVTVIGEKPQAALVHGRYSGVGRAGAGQEGNDDRGLEDRTQHSSRGRMAKSPFRASCTDKSV